MSRTPWDRLRSGVMFEVRLYASLARWVARRPSIPAGTEPVGYARLVTPIMWLWIFGSAVEIPVAHLLLPWDRVRGLVLLLGIWGLLWMVGLLASLSVHPHLLSDVGLRVRHGSSVDLLLRWDVLAGVQAERRQHPSSMRAVQVAGDELAVAVSGETNVVARLSRPLALTTHQGTLLTETVRFLVDDPRAFVARVSSRLPFPAAEPHG